MRKSRTNVWAVWVQRMVVAGFSVIAVMVSTAGAAEEYPRKPLTYTIFWPPGGRSDIVARMISPFVEKHLGTPVVVNNNVGGAGVIGHKEVREAKPDGYVLAQRDDGHVSVHQTRDQPVGLHVGGQYLLGSLRHSGALGVPVQEPQGTG